MLTISVYLKVQWRKIHHKNYYLYHLQSVQNLREGARHFVYRRSSENPHVSGKPDFNIVWAGIIDGHCTLQHCFNAQNDLEFIHFILTEGALLPQRRNIWFQQDGASIHTEGLVE